MTNLQHQLVSRICSSCTPTSPNYCMLRQRRRTGPSWLATMWEM